jgi:predicted dehydrogenase
MIRVAVIGAGRWGPNLINNFHTHQRSEVAWVVDSDESRLERVRARFPDVQTASNADAALSDGNLDCVVVATPTDSHFALAKAALEAGKHVLVEKPITGSLRSAEELGSIAQSTGLVLMVGHIFVYNSAAQQVKRYLDEGELGQIYYISMVRTNLGPIRIDVNSAWDLASHDIALSSYWLEAEPISASAVGGAWINPGLEDTVFATLRYPGDVLVNLHVSWLNPRKARNITLVGENRMLTFDDLDMTEPLRIYDKQVSPEVTNRDFIDTFGSFRMSIRDGDVTIPKVVGGEPLRNECDHFLDCVESGQPPLTGAREGIAVIRVLEAISRSIENGGAAETVQG